ncbi:hypothetical protein [Sellimonas intestinalis]|uniref:hypothetical protein n=1 Tax=Sellimonas intestinalis TaxID=1653434 RepID=UPI003990ECE0
MRKMAYTFAAILLAAVFGLTGCGGDFDAVGYMQAVLDERLPGGIFGGGADHGHIGI